MDKENTSNDQETKGSVKTIQDYICGNEYELSIPNYQRPYKWTTKHVHQLIDDILYFKGQDQSPYRLGTVVLYKNKNSTDENPKYEIVDGQQRTITLLLILLAWKKLKCEELNLDENTIEPNLNHLENLEFNNSISKYNIHNNYQEIQSRVKQFAEKDKEEFIKFLLEKCQIVIFTLNNLSECFQFFDSQNARGKDLSPHDLLKAYHLRAMANNSQDEKQAVVEKWESHEKGEIENLLGTYLFRIKQWVKGNKAWYFGKEDIHVFKGMELYDQYQYPYEGLAKIVTEILNLLEAYQVGKENSAIKFPFQLDQVSINGKHFFKMVEYYMELYEYLSHNNDDPKENSPHPEIIKLINTYGKRNRTGDKYIRNLFDCALLYYIDKFGLVDINNITKKIFIWAYSIRIKNTRVSANSVVNAATTDQNSLFKYINEAIMHHNVHQVQLKPLSSAEIKGTGLGEIQKMFKKLGYYKQNEEN